MTYFYRPIKTPLQYLIQFVAILLLIPAIVYSSWRLYRYVNWNLIYKDEVHHSLKKLIKPECFILEEKDSLNDNR